MQLKIQRSQRAGGVLGGTVFFCLDIRADYSAAERNNILKYKLGGEPVYTSRKAARHLDNAGAYLDGTQSGGVDERAGSLARGVFSLALAKMNLNITIASLGRGHHIECKDLEELLEAEETVRNACKNVTRFLEVAETFDGSEVVIEYQNGEERVHVTQGAAALLSYDGGSTVEPPALLTSPAAEVFSRTAGASLSTLEERWLTFERRLVDFLASKGWEVDPIQVRFVCAAAAFVAFLLLVVVL